MRKIIVTLIPLMIVGGAIMGWLFLQNQSASAPKNKTTTPLSAKDNKNTPNPNEHHYMDVDFARKMIVHNQQGIQMADIAKKNSTNEEIRQIATLISEELSSDTAQYANWLKEWKETYFNLSDFPQMDGHDMYPTHPGMATLSELSALEAATGASIDEQFLRLMIIHHEGAKELADSSMYDDMQFGKMIDLKTKTLKRQAEEIRVMKQLQTNE